jgi:hypothetical protein
VRGSNDLNNEELHTSHTSRTVMKMNACGRMSVMGDRRNAKLQGLLPRGNKPIITFLPGIFPHESKATFTFYRGCFPAVIKGLTRLMRLFSHGNKATRAFLPGLFSCI